LAEAQKEANQLSDVMEQYRAEHIRSAETLRLEVLECWGSAISMRRRLRSPGAPLGHSTSG
jgi:hypothetical protein